jgi:hypothetical protein
LSRTKNQEGYFFQGTCGGELDAHATRDAEGVLERLWLLLTTVLAAFARAMTSYSRRPTER